MNDKKINWTYRNVNVICGHCGKKTRTLHAVKNKKKNGFEFKCTNCVNSSE